ncbi:M23 family metallopeptidase [Candidatus Parcubacteria bacterium]|nr:M23 family metallopeptidase [Candidatus Parcubacteria bacterium]
MASWSDAIYLSRNTSQGLARGYLAWWSVGAAQGSRIILSSTQSETKHKRLQLVSQWLKGQAVWVGVSAVVFVVAAGASAGDLGGPAGFDAVGLQGLFSEQIVEEGISNAHRPLGGPASFEARLNVLADAGAEIDNGEAILLAGDSLLVPLPPLTTETSAQERSGITQYTVKSGDTVSAIAAHFGVTADTVLWANGLGSSSTIQPGQTLQILPVSGVKHEVKSGDTLSKIAKRYNASVDDIIAFNTLPADEGSVLNIGEIFIVPGGEQPRPRAPVRIATPRRGGGAGASVVGYFIFPTTGYNFGRYHGFNGTDIASPCGTPIYASAGGLIEVAKARGWNGGYGNYVRIQHPNGTQTVYGHMQSVAVAPGESVNQGDPIGLMGTTGRSTGCHLHFEVRGATNPFVRYR